jgi:hypothetical protein
VANYTKGDITIDDFNDGLECRYKAGTTWTCGNLRPGLDSFVQFSGLKNGERASEVFMLRGEDRLLPAISAPDKEA